MRSFVFASNNKGKLVEVSLVAKEYDFSIIGPHELCGETWRQDLVKEALLAPPDVEETADTYLGNAKLKAEAFFHWCKLPCCSDDAGLEVDALGGGPGLHTARYAGEEASSAQNRAKLLAALKGETNRKARFRCVLYLIKNEDEYLTSEAIVEGQIGHQEEGAGGFGYDSIFIPEGYDSTLASLKDQGLIVKTHRVLALESLFRKGLSILRFFPFQE